MEILILILVVVGFVSVGLAAWGLFGPGGLLR